MLMSAAPGFDAAVASSPPLQVWRVYVQGGAWTPEFKQYFGMPAFSPQFGFEVYSNNPPAPMPYVLPWVNIDRVTVTFNYPVRAEADDLRLRGVTVPNYPVMAVEITNDSVSGTYAATWTLGRPLANDRLLIEVDGGPEGVKTPWGQQLDGDEDLVPGGDYHIRVNALPGNANNSGGIVDGGDIRSVREGLGTSVTNLGVPGRYYTMDADTNGDGRVNAIDVSEVRRRYLTRLPRTAPVITVMSEPALSTRIRPVARSLFSTSLVLA